MLLCVGLTCLFGPPVERLDTESQIDELTSSSALRPNSSSLLGYTLDSSDIVFSENNTLSSNRGLLLFEGVSSKSDIKACLRYIIRL